MPQLTLRLAARAERDIARLYAFLRTKDSNAAKRALQAIRAAFQALARARLIGRPVEDSTDLRELVVDFGASGYLALYRFESHLNSVTILAIKHQLEDDYK